jgi:CheY-like chemotaxis protein/two-component sensor histidine kinase
MVALLVVLTVALAALAGTLAAWGLGLRRRAEQLSRELPALQDQLVHTERLRAMSDIAAAFAHSFNETLTPVIGRTQLLAQRITDPGLREWLTAIERAALHGAEKVRRIQGFTRIRRDDPAVRVDLNTVIHEAVAALEPHRRAGIEIKTQLQEVPTIAGDARGLTEVVLNLAMNAIEAMPRGGTVTISTASDQGDAVVAVADTGMGMSPDVQENMFDPFFSTKPSRTGLGLALAYGVVARHGAQLEVETTPGQGTTVRIRFPVEAPAGTVRRPTADTVPVSETPVSRCLVVDDDPDVREAVRDMLALGGHRVVLAVDGADGVDKFKAGTFDLVVTDLAMPKLNGLQLTRICKALRPEIPVLMVTGWGVVLTEDELAEHGVDAVISKPVRMTEFLSTVSTLKSRTPDAPGPA